MKYTGVLPLAVLALLLHTVHVTNGHNVLVANPVATIHVRDALCAVAKGLVLRGHQVTMLTSYPPTFAHRNFTIIKVTPKLNLLQNLNLFSVNSSVLETHTAAVLDAAAKALWEDPPDKRSRDNLQPSTYDAVIIPEFLNELVYPFLKDFQGVFVPFYSQGAEHHIVSNAPDLKNSLLSVNPTTDAPYFESYSLKDRFFLSLFYLNGTEIGQSRIHPHARKLIRTYSPHFSGLDDILLQSRVSLLDTHRLLHGPPMGLQPGQVEVAGLGIKVPQALSQEIETLLKVHGGKGIIYVSLGSYTKSSYIPKSLKEALLEALGQLPYYVLWQYDGVDLRNKDNVYKRKVMPQQDILGDNRTVLFVSYCSTSALQQAVHHGVPVLALPVALDQENNAKKLEMMGVARTINWRVATADLLLEAATALIHDASYSDRMKRMSRLLRDQRESPAERAAWWVEYAIRRHDDAPPLLPSDFTVQAVCDLYLLMVWAEVAALLGLLAGVALTLFCSCICLCCKKSKPKKKAE
ncbi:UDP-glucuronosyl/UDP-glucosyltransferase [Trinorchestia longiramus]|nr:UDP-glucuronosyl/UDP-glucosyltransferase [Trinorchestia longiramus]